MSDALTLTYHQGKPEATFDYYRTVISQLASLPDYEVWLEQQQNAIMYDYGSIAKEITQKALALRQEADTPMARDLQAYLIQADRTTQKPSQDGFFQAHIKSSAMTAEKPQKTDTEEVKLQKVTSANTKQQAYWENFLRQLDAQQPKDEEEKEIMILQLEEERVSVQARLENLRAVKRTYDDRLQREDYEAATQLAATADIQGQIIPFTSSKWVTAGMKQAAYYMVDGADSLVHPTLEPVALARYDQKLLQLQETAKRIKGTASVIAKRAEAITNRVGVDTTIVEEVPQEDIEWAYTLIKQADKKETAGDEDVMEFLDTAISQKYTEKALNAWQQDKHVDPSRTIAVSLMQATAHARKRILDDTAAQISIAESIRSDYLMVLSAINPKLVVVLETGKISANLMNEVTKAEAEYNAFLEDFFATYTPPEHPDEDGSQEHILYLAAAA
jgi:hypothetical protein